MEYTRLLKNTKPMTAGDDVKDIQQILFSLGYYKGKIDGEYGPKTEAAVLEYQKAKKIKPYDGKVGPKTWAALHLIAPKKSIRDFLAYVALQVGSLYVSGAQGETLTEARIKYLEKDPDDERRALTKFFDHVKRLLSRIGYDCSGLIIKYLLDNKLIKQDYNANGIYYTLCDPIEKSELQAGDLVFKKKLTSSRIYHVGVYMGDGTVVHSKGRDYGVIREDISKAGWNRYGRLRVF